MPQQERR